MNLTHNKSNKNEMSHSISLYKSQSFNKSSLSITKKNTIEYETPFSKEISREKSYSLFENNKNNITNLDKNENITKSLSYNGFEESYKKVSSIKSMNNDNPILLNKNSGISSNNEIKFFSNNFPFFTKVKIPNQSKIITNYKKWEGYNYFPFQANVIEGPCSFRPTLMTACTITLPTIFFLVFNSKYIADKITIFIPFIIIIIYIISFIYLIIASFCDPGIIRRFSLVNKNKDYIKNNQIQIIRKDCKIFQLGYLHTYKFCPSCGIIRPNRSTHCADCNNCVERLDHHCPWIGNCAGKRNYIYFFIFLVSFNILTILIVIFSIIHIVFRVRDYSDINKELPEDKKINHLIAYSFCEVIISLYLIIFCIITMCFITGLIFYHCRLILINSTTKEELRHLFKSTFGNPYKRNICTNIKNVLCIKTKKYSILDILRGDLIEICDYKNINNSNSNRGKKIQEEEVNDETISKINFTDLNNINVNLDYQNNNVINGEDTINNSKYSLKKNIEFLNGKKLKNDYQEGNSSFEIIKNKDKLEEYLKHFGTGINTHKQKETSEDLSQNQF